MKDILVENWRNGQRNIKHLMAFRGVEVALCVQNARRVQLLDVLRSPMMAKYLKTI